MTCSLQYKERFSGNVWNLSLVTLFVFGVPCHFSKPRKRSRLERETLRGEGCPEKGATWRRSPCLECAEVILRLCYRLLKELLLLGQAWPGRTHFDWGLVHQRFTLVARELGHRGGPGFCSLQNCLPCNRKENNWNKTCLIH